jgi:hypothetical protein
MRLCVYDEPIGKHHRLSTARRERNSSAVPIYWSEGGIGKLRVIETVAELFASKGISHGLLVTATSRTAATRINGLTIHSACNFSKDASRTGYYRDVDGIASSASADLCIDGQARTDWQEKYLLIIDEVSMLGARTLRGERTTMQAARVRARLRRHPHRPFLWRLPPVPACAGEAHPPPECGVSVGRRKNLQDGAEIPTP